RQGAGICPQAAERYSQLPHEHMLPRIVFRKGVDMPKLLCDRSKKSRAHGGTGHGVPGVQIGLDIVQMLDDHMRVIDPVVRGLRILFVEIEQPANKTKGKKRGE